MRANTKSLPAYVGYAEPNGTYTVIKVAKVVDAVAPDDAKLSTTRQRLQQTLGQKELVSVIAQLRSDVGVSISPGATDKKADK
jgi:peptidyl-prolyl cis-trans isomerase D